ncbi:adenine nucleotide alpha hydrolase [Gemmata sp. JC673]|uniref:Adenine nucleotide alpha hydrolase n=1 Tax=Gemmata algarum TaxID=2975278 RepID=A0ABU5F0T6_9BACT|nr:ATP-binding protein [Gemmata algarum]MDY3561175.1 adenine nucleotide alpha hydrolase [Gemmata algarum]
MRPKVLLSWSSGKDSAWALHVLRQRGEVEVVGLVTTLNEAFGRVAMHGVRAELVRAQAEAAGLPLWTVPLPWPCSNDQYESRMRGLVERARAAGVSGLAFGDLFLADVRAYRERQLAGSGIEPLFPLWGAPADTPALAREMIGAGLRATLACVDPKQLAPQFVGREFDTRLLAELPPGADPCGENGEFHTFCHAGPVFDRPIPVRVGDTIERDGFCFADLLPGAAPE